MADAGRPGRDTAEEDPLSPSGPDAGPDLRRLAGALSRVPERDRSAVLAHIEALAMMSPAKRAALLTLTGEPGE